MRWQTGWYYLAEHFPTWGPATALSQAIDEPQQGEHGYSRGPGEDHIDAPYQEKANGEKPAGADLIWQHAADELTDGIGHSLAAGDQTCRDTVKIAISVWYKLFTEEDLGCYKVYTLITHHYNILLFSLLVWLSD